MRMLLLSNVDAQIQAQCEFSFTVPALPKGVAMHTTRSNKLSFTLSSVEVLIMHYGEGKEKQNE